MAKPVYCTVLAQRGETEVSFEGWLNTSHDGGLFTLQPSHTYDPDGMHIGIPAETVTMIYPKDPKEGLPGITETAPFGEPEWEKISELLRRYDDILGIANRGMRISSVSRSSTSPGPGSEETDAPKPVTKHDGGGPFVLSTWQAFERLMDSIDRDKMRDIETWFVATHPGKANEIRWWVPVEVHHAALQLIGGIKSVLASYLANGTFWVEGDYIFDPAQVVVAVAIHPIAASKYQP